MVTNLALGIAEDAPLNPAGIYGVLQESARSTLASSSVIRASRSANLSTSHATSRSASGVMRQAASIMVTLRVQVTDGIMNMAPGMF
jgi:hypothetical protein